MNKDETGMTHSQEIVPAPSALSAFASQETRFMASDTEAIEEALWVRQTAQGDLKAFDYLMSRYRERALRLATHVLRRAEEAEDAVQEAFLRAYGQAGDFRGDSRFYTWFYRILVRVCLNRMRIPYWQRQRLFLEDLPAHTKTNGSLSASADTRMLAETLLERLSPPLRAALVLRVAEGLEYEEIAEALEIPVGTVRSRLSAARERLRQIWEDIEKETSHV